MFNKFYKTIAFKTVFSVIVSFLVAFVCIFTGSSIIKKESLAKLNYIVEQNTHTIEIPFQLFEKSSDNLSQIISNLIEIKQNKIDYLIKNGYKKQLDNEIRKFFTTNENIEQIYLHLDKKYSLSPLKNEFYFDNKQFENFNPKNSENLFFQKQFYLKREVNITEYKDSNGFWSNSFIDKNSNKYMISYKKLIKYNDQNIGYMLIKISINNYLNSMKNYNTYKDASSFFIDGHFCFISNEKLYKNMEKNTDFKNQLKQKLNKNHRGIIFYKNHQTAMIAGFEKMGNGLIYVITAPKKEIFQPEQNLQFLIGSVFALGIMFYVLIILNI